MSDLFKSAGRVLGGKGSSGSHVTTRPHTAEASQRPSVDSPVATRQRGGTIIRGGRVNLGGEIFGGAAPIGGQLNVGGSLVIGHVQPAPVNKASTLAHGDGNAVKDDYGTTTTVEFEEINITANARNAYMPVNEVTTVGGDMVIGKM